MEYIEINIVFSLYIIALSAVTSGLTISILKNRMPEGECSDSKTTASAVTVGRTHPDPSRTRKLRPPAPMVLRPTRRGRAGHRRDHIRERPLPGRQCDDAAAPAGAYTHHTNHHHTSQSRIKIRQTNLSRTNGQHMRSPLNISDG